jgi:hypothetical protein
VSRFGPLVFSMIERQNKKVHLHGPLIDCNMLERCLKTGLHIIYQKDYVSFEHALNLANMKSLKERRITQITKFSKQALKSEKYRGWFSETEAPAARPGPSLRPTAGRRPPPRLRPVTCRTQRYQQSALPVMTELLAWHPPLAWRGVRLN